MSPYQNTDKSWELQSSSPWLTALHELTHVKHILDKTDKFSSAVTGSFPEKFSNPEEWRTTTGNYLDDKGVLCHDPLNEHTFMNTPLLRF